MKVINYETDLAKHVSEAWDKQYKEYISGPYTEIGKKLHALSSYESMKEKIDEIIGNEGWTKLPTCTVCKKATKILIECSSSYWMCPKCVKEAASLLKG